MLTNKSYTPQRKENISKRLYKSEGIWVYFMLFLSLTANSQDIFIKDPIEPITTYDEVPVAVIVDGYFNFETDVIITENQTLFINIEELFKNLGIYTSLENEGNNLVGFIENEANSYMIDYNNKQITVGKKTVKSMNGIVKEMNAIYIESTLLTEAFGLSIVFNYRSLSIKLKAAFELPLVKQMRLEKIRQNISKLQEKTTEVDATVQRAYHLVKLGMLDWSIASYQTKNEKTTNRFGLGLGAELLYGEANISLNYDNQYQFDERQLQYQWRWIDNANPYIKQAQIGKLFNQSISFLEAPVVGGSFNNSPNTVRKATGTYILSEYTEPNWTVELYINDVLVDYTAADASGLYEFKVPNVYGYTTLKLKFYGPLGEERMEERTLNTPYTLMPTGELEYNVSGGILQDEANSKFARGVFHYGVNRFLTVGGGVEYLSSIPDNPLIPFTKLSFQPFSKLILNLEYAHEVRMKGILNYSLGRSAFLEMDYAKYKEGQLATRFNANEERKIKISVPFKRNWVSGYTKLNYNQYIYNTFNYNQLDAIVTGYYKNFNVNSSTLVNWVNDKSAYTTTHLSVSYSMRNGWLIRPSVAYAISNNKLMRYRAELEKRVAKMYFSASFERAILSKENNFFLSFKYDLPFARTGFSSSFSNNRFNFSEHAQGSLAFGGDNGHVHAGNNSALGKGGLLVYPFLDLNHNGKRDAGEKLVWVNRVKVAGG